MISEKNIVLTLAEILDFDFRNKNIAILGFPGAGKTWLSKKICTGTHIKISTDTYIPFGYEQSMYYALEEANNVIGNFLVEGIQVYRMLRKGAELDNFKPHIIIECEISRARMEEIYLKERNPDKIKYLKGFIQANQKVLNGYRLLMEDQQKPIWIKWENKY